MDFSIDLDWNLSFYFNWYIDLNWDVLYDFMRYLYHCLIGNLYDSFNGLWDRYVNMSDLFNLDVVDFFNWGWYKNFNVSDNFIGSLNRVIYLNLLNDFVRLRNIDYNFSNNFNWDVDNSLDWNLSHNFVWLGYIYNNFTNYFDWVFNDSFNRDVSDNFIRLWDFNFDDFLNWDWDICLEWYVNKSFNVLNNFSWYWYFNNSLIWLGYRNLYLNLIFMSYDLNLLLHCR